MTSLSMTPLSMAQSGMAQLGMAQSSMTGPEPAGADETATVEWALSLAATNPLLSIVSRLTWLAGRFTTCVPDDVDALRTCLASEIRRISTHPELDSATRATACYALSATFDDLALNAPWGGGDAWARSTLVSLMFNETCGGERFFTLLAQLQLDPARNADKLALMAVCLALGFQGKFRVLPQGGTELALIRATLKRMMDETEATRQSANDIRARQRLAPENAPYRAPLVSRLVVAAVAATALAITGTGAAMTLHLGSALGHATSVTQTLIPGDIPHWQTPEMPVPTAPRPAQTTPEPLAETPNARLARLLAPEIAQGLVAIVDSQGATIVRLAGAGLFASAQATLAPGSQGLIARVSAALDGLSPSLQVIGHADNQPIRTRTIRSNVVLAERRAEAVTEALRHHLEAGTTITAQGRGDSEPIASNATAEGRASNRRIEILVPGAGTPNNPDRR